MFDISFFEILIVAIASFTFLGVKDTLAALKSIKKFIANIRSSFDEYIKFLDEETKSEPDLGDNILEEIVDLDGNLQKRYDLSKIMPEIKKAKND
jgi:Sec-independent protein translocase protein TatA